MNSIIGVNWKTKEEAAMEEAFLSLGKKGLTMNHYDLAEVTSVKDPQAWKHFLQNEYVSKYITDEFTAIQDSELRKLIMNISDSSSVGKAQIINSLQKVLNEHAGDKKSGPAFIYTYVPLTDVEKQADNVEVLDSDPFLKTVPNRMSK
jgi:hypothetical protein